MNLFCPVVQKQLVVLSEARFKVAWIFLFIYFDHAWCLSVVKLYSWDVAYVLVRASSYHAARENKSKCLSSILYPCHLATSKQPTVVRVWISMFVLRECIRWPKQIWYLVTRPQNCVRVLPSFVIGFYEAFAWFLCKVAKWLSVALGDSAVNQLPKSLANGSLYFLIVHLLLVMTK